MSDWWTQPSTPARASAFHSPARASTSRARFVADDPDPSAEGAPKFLPSFVGSPAGKLLGTSPGSAPSPPAPKRSPTARFSVSLAESTSSPRHTRSTRAAAPNDDDAIPTTSLHDDPVRPSSVAQASTSVVVAATPPALEAASDTTTLHVWGPPPEHLSALRPYLESIGPVVSYVPGPDGSNWWTVTYANPLAASYALRRHGEIVSGRWMLGFKVAGPGSTQGLTLVNGVPPTQSVVPAGGVGAGIPMQINTGNIIRAKPKPPTQTEDYAWEETEQQPAGLIGRAAEFIFGR